MPLGRGGRGEGAWDGASGEREGIDLELQQPHAAVAARREGWVLLGAGWGLMVSCWVHVKAAP